MTVGLCAVVLAAGAGTRLRPLTETVPKALCPVGNVTSLDRALARLAHHGFSGPARVAVNACHLADRVTRHVGGRAYMSVEPGPTALGTAGAIANLRDWIGGRAVIIGNADAYLASHAQATSDLAVLLQGWDRQSVRVLCVAAEPGQAAEFRAADSTALRFAGFSLVPAPIAQELPLIHSDLVRAVWRPAEAAGRLELVTYDGVYLDTGTPADYLAANLHAAGPGSLIAASAVVNAPVEHSVIGAGAEVLGPITRCVIWPGARVAAGENLVDAIRVGEHLTVDAGISSTA